jgi:hypothetical protein
MDMVYLHCAHAREEERETAAARHSELAYQEIIMAPIPRLKEYAAASMQRGSLRQVLTVILVAGMLIVVIVPIPLGVAIQQGTIAPPQLDVRLGGLHLIAYATHPPDCDRYVTPCQAELVAPAGQEFYVIWIWTRTGQLDAPQEWQTGTRLLTLPLRKQFIPQ